MWHQMSFKIRFLLAVSVFLIFATLGPLSILMDNPLRHISLTGVIIVTICSGGVSASIILLGRRIFWLIFFVLLFTTGNVFSLQIEEYLTGATPKNVYSEINNNVVVAKKEFQSIGDERTLLGLFSILLIALGYTMFIVTLYREGRERIRLETEFGAAKKIQESLNPKEKLISGSAEVFGMTISAQEVGGDFFDYRETDTGGITAFVSDVSGHGIGAGIIAAMTKSALYSHKESLGNPRELFYEINKTLCMITEKSHFVTAAYVNLVPEQGLLHAITAGHHPIYQMESADKHITKLRKPNLAFGMHPDFVYNEEIVKYRKGDIFLLYTDGIIEARNASGEEFGDVRLESALRDYAGNGADIICSAIISDLTRFTGKSSFDDDITLLCIKT